MVPSRAKQMPTVQTITYFQAASKEVRVNLKATSRAEIRVVASMATHMRPILSTSTTSIIVQTKRWDRA